MTADPRPQPDAPCPAKRRSGSMVLTCSIAGPHERHSWQPMTTPDSSATPPRLNPTRPQPDAAPGETCPHCPHPAHWLVWCLRCTCYGHRYEPAPPSAPASAPEEEVAERRWVSETVAAVESDNIALRAALEAAQQEAARWREALEAIERGAYTHGIEAVKQLARRALAATPPAAPPEGSGFCLDGDHDFCSGRDGQTPCNCACHQPPPADADALDQVLGSISLSGPAPRSDFFDADALRERVLADWADCPHCHHWGHQHRYGVCMVCDKRDQTCGLFALTPPPAAADALREARREELQREADGWNAHLNRLAKRANVDALAAPQPPAGEPTA